MNKFLAKYPLPPQFIAILPSLIMILVIGLVIWGLIALSGSGDITASSVIDPNRLTRLVNSTPPAEVAGAATSQYGPFPGESSQPAPIATPKASPTPSPSPSATPTPTPSPASTPSSTPEPTPSEPPLPTPTPSSTPDPVATDSATTP